MVKLLSSNINIILAKYIIEPKKTLKKWVKPFIGIENSSNFEYVYATSCNPTGLNSDKLNVYKLSKCNTIIAKIILKYLPDKIIWCYLSENSSKWAYKLFKNNLDKIYWSCLSEMGL